MDIEEEREVEREVEEEGDGNQGALGALEFLTQDADLSGTTLIDSCNGFNELSFLIMMWTVWHCWPAGGGGGGGWVKLI